MRPIALPKYDADSQSALQDTLPVPVLLQRLCGIRDQSTNAGPATVPCG